MSPSWCLQMPCSVNAEAAQKREHNRSTKGGGKHKEIWGLVSSQQFICSPVRVSVCSLVYFFEQLPFTQPLAHLLAHLFLALHSQSISDSFVRSFIRSFVQLCLHMLLLPLLLLQLLLVLLQLAAAAAPAAIASVTA